MTAPEIFDDAIDAGLVADLRDAILARALPGRPYPGGANRGGWKSSIDLFSWPEPPFQELKGRIARALEAAGGFRTGSAWTVVNRNGSYHGRHRHGSPLMGILFIAPGDPPVPTVFETGPSEAERVEVEPIAGRLVLCGDIYHCVPVYRGESPRIVVAFDARLGVGR